MKWKRRRTMSDSELDPAIAKAKQARDAAVEGVRKRAPIWEQARRYQGDDVVYDMVVRAFRKGGLP